MKRYLKMRATRKSLLSTVYGALEHLSIQAIKFAVAGGLALTATAASAVTVWEGEWSGPHEDSTDEIWIFKTKCNFKDECMTSAGIMKDGKYVAALPLTEPLSLKTDKSLTRSLRLSVQYYAVDDPELGGNYNRTIYPQIGTPERVVECRSISQLPVAICLLDTPLIDVGAGRRSEWVILVADRTTTGACRGFGSVCPGLLTKNR